MRRRLLVLAVVATTLACGGASAPEPQSARARPERAPPESGSDRGSPAPGARAEQLALGAEVYERECAGCHGADGRGGAAPPVIGPETLPASRFHSAEDLVDYLRDHVPEVLPGTLPDREYVGVAAYLIDANRIPVAGAPGTGAMKSATVAGAAPSEG